MTQLWNNECLFDVFKHILRADILFIARVLARKYYTARKIKYQRVLQVLYAKPSNLFIPRSRCPR